MEDISDVVTELVPLKEAFPCLIELLQISMTISVSTAKCKRSFSTLKRIKSYLRSTMSEKRLNDMAILSIEHDLSQKFDLEAVVTEFAKSNKRIALELRLCILATHSILRLFTVNIQFKHFGDLAIVR